jgi:ABC-2 type transport system permease protein
VNPVTAGEQFVGKILVSGHAWNQDISWLASPLAAAVLFAAAAPLFGARFLRLFGGIRA